ncbi:hypothetical protein HDU98_011204 [Podochytrium sp. JEL0797]|nr:hypothetical protein HDU98_011204 [Podochytrium sp. JEL0797]
MSPSVAKALGRRVQDFDAAVWAIDSLWISDLVLLIKVLNNAGVLRELLQTRDLMICEASPRDTLWGIGVGAKNTDVCLHPQKWRGRNELGKSWMRVRDYLLATASIQHQSCSISRVSDEACSPLAWLDADDTDSDGVIGDLDIMAAIVNIPAHSDFPLENIPFGIISTVADPTPRAATAIGDYAVDLRVLSKAGLFDGPLLKNGVAERVFAEPTLNAFMRLGRPAWREARATLQTLLSAASPIKNNAALKDAALHPRETVRNHLPVQIGDYTDFYSSREHAFNVGVMFRGKDNALQPNWVHIPVGYHGRASSVVVSGTPIRRPNGLIQDFVSKEVLFSQCKKLDYELETAFIIGTGNDLGAPIKIEDAEQHMFGMVLMNDWSARDIQAFEYVPLGPFLGKNFGTTISPWIVTMDALEPFRVAQPLQDPTPANYLRSPSKDAYDLQLECTLKPNGSSKDYTISKTNLKYMYWSMKQQLAHHAVNGCNMNAGDLLGSGTISGPDTSSLGSLLEGSLNGKQDIVLSEDGTVTRRFIEDGDSLTITGKCEAEVNGKKVRIGFGACEGTVLPAVKF